MLTKVLATLFFALTFTQSNLNWDITSISSTGNSVNCNSLALDNNNFPIISYCYNNMSTSGYSLNIARCHDHICANTTFVTIDENLPGGNTPLILDSNGYPVISYGSYYNGINIELKLARCHDMTCSSPILTTIDSGGNINSLQSLALDSNGYPVISYYKYVNKTGYYSLKLARCHDMTCISPTLITLVYSIGSAVSVTSLVLDSNDYSVISYYDAKNYGVKIVRCYDTTCTSPIFSTVDNEGVFCSSLSLELDSGSNPVIGYTNVDLKLARCHDPNCSSVTLNFIDKAKNIGFASLALDNNNYPLIAYSNLATEEESALRFARCHNLACSNAILTTIIREDARFNSLILDNSSYPFISYIDCTKFLLKLSISTITPTHNPTKIPTLSPSIPTLNPSKKTSHPTRATQSPTISTLPPTLSPTYIPSLNFTINPSLHDSNSPFISWEKIVILSVSGLIFSVFSFCICKKMCREKEQIQKPPLIGNMEAQNYVEKEGETAKTLLL